MNNVAFLWAGKSGDLSYFAGPYDKKIYDIELRDRTPYHSFWVEIEDLDIIHNMVAAWDDADEDEGRGMVMGANGGCRRYANENEAEQTLMRLAFGDEEKF